MYSSIHVHIHVTYEYSDTVIIYYLCCHPDTYSYMIPNYCITIGVKVRLPHMFKQHNYTARVTLEHVHVHTCSNVTCTYVHEHVHVLLRDVHYTVHMLQPSSPL